MNAPTTVLMERVAALRSVIRDGVDLLPHDALQDAAGVVRRAEGRLRHGTDFTVVALAGATGSGKSSLFNALVGDPVSPVGVTRPTTDVVRAAVFGSDSPDGLLQWLQVRHRHGVAGGSLDGLVLLDLPDHDSVVADHRLEVDRLVELVDVLIWVLDPQKYADDALHSRYLAHLSDHADSMLFILNQADQVPEADHERWAAHAARVLADDGIAEPSLYLTSATTGAGLNAVRTELAARIAGREAALARIDADLRTVVAGLGEVPQPIPPATGLQRRLQHDLAGAAGAELIAGAVADGYRFDATRRTGWPFARWLLRFRRHPLRALQPTAPPTADTHRPERPTAVPIDVPRMEMALRTYADTQAGDADPRWARRARVAANARVDVLPAVLGQAVRSVAASSITPPAWWRRVGAVQTFLAGVTLAGAAWLALLLLLEYLKVPTEILTPELGGWPVPTVLLLGGAAAGLLVALLARFGAAAGAKRRAKRATATLEEQLATIASDYVTVPLDDEFGRWRDLSHNMQLAAGASADAAATR